MGKPYDIILHKYIAYMCKWGVMNYCAFMLVWLCFLKLYGADDDLAPYQNYSCDMPLISNKGEVLHVPDFLIPYSPVLTNARNFPSEKHNSFGFSASALRLLLRLLYFESQYANGVLYRQKKLYREFKHDNYLSYNDALEKATTKFKELFLNLATHAYTFELAHFFCLQTVLLCIANIGTTPYISEHTLTRLMAKYKKSQHPYPSLYLEMLGQRLSEQDCAARHVYIYDNKVTPFFKGLTISDLIRLGVFTKFRNNHSKMLLMLNKKSLYSFHGIERIPYASSCKTLSLAQNYFTHISDHISIFKNIVSLNLANNYLTSANFVKHLPQLQFLALAHNFIKKFSGKIQQLNSLEKLDLSRNRLTAVSIKKDALNKLKHLVLHTNYITIFKKAPNSLKNIIQIDLGINRLSSPPAQNFEHMQELFLDINQIAAMPTMNGLLNVQRLTLADNHITHIEPHIAQLTQLEMLDLSDNALIDITPLAQLKNLTMLILKRNKITAEHARDFFKLLTPNKEQPECLLQKLQFLDLTENPAKEKKIICMCSKVNKHRLPGRQLHITNLSPLVTKSH